MTGGVNGESEEKIEEGKNQEEEKTGEKTLSEAPCGQAQGTQECEKARCRAQENRSAQACATTRSRHGTGAASGGRPRGMAVPNGEQAVGCCQRRREPGEMNRQAPRHQRFSMAAMRRTPPPAYASRLFSHRS